VSAARGLVKAVHILCDDGGEEAHLFQLSQPEMGRVRSCGQDESEHLLQHEPDLFRIPLEGIDMGVFLWIIFFPEALSTPEVGNTTLDRDPRASESHRL